MVAPVVSSESDRCLPTGSTPLVTRDGHRIVVWLDGELDIATRPLLTQTLATALSVDSADQIVDLSRVTFIDAAAIGTLMGHRNSLFRQSRSMTLRCPSPFARRVLDLCGLTDLIEPG